MWRLDMMEPPQKGVISPGDTRPTCVGCWCWIHIHYSHTTVLCLTCHGYSFTSVSTPPTILARLLAWPQLQVLLLLLEVVAAVGVVLIIGYIYHNNTYSTCSCCSIGSVGGGRGYRSCDYRWWRCGGVWKCKKYDSSNLIFLKLKNGSRKGKGLTLLLF